MADNSLQSLADALTNAEQPVVLNAAFITAAGLTAPDGFDDALKAAFRLGETDAGLKVSFNAGDVGNISNNSFQVTNAQLTEGFLGAPAADTTVTLTFSLPATELQVQVEADLANWTFTTFFTYMVGWPFTLLNVASPAFIFSTVKTNYNWSGTSVSLTPGQNFAASFTVPPQFQPIFNIVQGLGLIPSTLPIYGPIAVDKVDNETILYPDMDLVANISNQTVSIFFLQLHVPFIGFQIETGEVEPEEDEEAALFAEESFGEYAAIEGGAQKQLEAGGYEDALEEIPFYAGIESPLAVEYAQNPLIYFGTQLDINLDSSQVQNVGDPGTATLDVKIALIYDAQQGASALPKNYSLSVQSAPDSDAILSPMTVANALMNGNSFFRYVPPQLQAFFSAVGFQGLLLNGPLTPTPGISSLSITLGNGGQQSISLISDPTNALDFTIETIELTWTIINPLGAAATRQNLVNFNTSFIIFPTVFRKLDGTPGGLFAVSIDQDFNIDGSFNGSVSLDDLLREVTKGAIGLPAGVEVSFSDVTLSISPPAKSYSFAFTFDGALDFITWGGQPLIQFQHMRFMLSAVTPTNSGSNGGGGGNGGGKRVAGNGGAATGTTVYRGSIEGVIGVGPIMVNTSVVYDGTVTPKVWTLSTSLAEPLVLSDLLAQFFRAFNLPDFLPGTLTVQSFSVDATIPVKSKNSKKSESMLSDDEPSESLILAADAFAAVDGDQPTYRVAGTIEWDSGNSLPEFPIKTTADIGLQYDGNKPEGQKFSGSVIGTLTLDAINTEVKVGYNFGTAKQDALALNLPIHTLSTEALAADSQTLWVQWNGLRATYDITDKTLTFTLNGWTVGSLLVELLKMADLADPYFTLDSPWDLLNQISLDNLELIFDFKPNVKNRVSAKYSLPSPIDLGFMQINGLVFQRINGKITIAIDGKINVPGLEQTPLFNPDGEGQDVKDMPSVPGHGNSLFDLRLLAFGQRVAIRGSETFESVEQVINALSGIKPTKGKENPVNPTDPTVGQPYYSQTHNWLVAANFGLLRAGNDYTLELMFVFNDPDLYGLRLGFNGDKAKVLDGLVIEVLYKKITDDIGLYQIDFSFPSLLRNIDFGAFSIVLPNLGIKIYTNGDFLFDFGFPYNLDFSRSFSVQAIILGVPVLGSAGFYFGKLSSATTNKVPQTTCGNFNPVIVFGLGVQVGVGRYFEKGPLKAGFSITVFGIIEGVIAAWHPYAGPPAGCQPIPTSGAVEDNYYFWLQGTFGVIGKLYGTIDFVIIKADVSLLVQVVAQVTFESYRAIPLSISAHVSIKVSIKIDLGLFSITISFSFAATISANLTIGSDSTAPWDGQALPQARVGRRRIAPTPRFMLAAFEDARLNFKKVTRGVGVVAPTLLVVPGPQFTVHTPDVTSTNPADQRGAFVFVLAMDAPTVDGTGDGSDSSFESLCAAMLPWVIDSLLNQQGDTANLSSLAATAVSKDQLVAIMKKLADTTTIPIPESAIMTFLQSGFTVNVVTPDAQYQKKLQAGATIFPAFSGYSLTFPNPNGQAGQTVTIDLGQYVTITDDYRVKMAELFQKLAARVQEESGAKPKFATDAVQLADEPLSRFILEDYFLLVARQLVQSAEDSLDDFAYPLEQKPSDAPGHQRDAGAESPLGADVPPPGSLQSILKWAHDRNNVSLVLDDIAEPNLTHGLTGGNVFTLSGLRYTVQGKDTLQSIATRYSDSAATPRWQTTPANLIITNAALNTLIQPNVTINITGKPPYVTQPGDSFASIAANNGITLAQLSQQQSLYGVDGLLAPSIILSIPDIAYTTAADASDTLQIILSKFSMSLAAFLVVEQNQTAPYFFDTKSSATIRIANLTSLYISDLWTAIQHDGKVAQTAGMVGRYQLHGMRLPNQPETPGLKLPSNFLYPTGQPDYGLFQLTGQQFPTPPFVANAAYNLTLGKNDSLSWLQFNGATATKSLPLDLSKQATQLNYVLQYALNPGYDPSPQLSVQPDVNVTPKRYAVRSATLWSTSDLAFLASITAPAARLADAVSAANEQPQTQPILWEMPESLLRQAEQRQAMLSTNTDLNVKESQPYLAVFTPEVGTTDPALRTTTFTAINDYAFATRIDFQIKRLAQTSDQASQTPFANDVVPPSANNPGSPAVPLAPYTYELLGPGPNDAVLLQRLLTAMDASGGLGEGIISGLFLLYPDNAAAPNGLVSRASSEFLSFITQTNLSTETNPPESFAAAFFSEGASPRGIANRPAEFIKLMWELSTVRSGGYYLYYEIVGQSVGLPESLFDSSGAATLTLVITYNRADEPTAGGRLTNYANAFVSTDPVDRNRSVMTLLSASAPATTQTLKGTESLQRISDVYGADVGVLAALNPTATFVNGKQIPVSGIIRRDTPADIQAG
ncbi:MAG TPA: LysM peptidoglycan-binding domain-containing protein, partial [Pyrinomonadaceae bacterium]